MPYFPRLSHSRVETHLGDASIGGSTVYYKPLPNPGGANAKGAWLEFFTATSFDVQWLLLNCQTAGNAWQFLDIGIGPAGSERVVVPNLMVTVNQAYGSNADSAITLPLFIPKGTRVAARYQYQSGGTAMFRLKMQLFSASFSAVQGPQVWEGWGQNTTTTRGATVIAGAAHVKGAWVELIAATTLEARWVCAAIQGLESARHYAFDMAIGAAGAEQVILPDMQFTGEQTGQFMGPLPLAIQKGARLAARMACQTAGSQSLFSAWGGS